MQIASIAESTALHSGIGENSLLRYFSHKARTNFSIRPAANPQTVMAEGLFSDSIVNVRARWRGKGLKGRWRIGALIPQFRATPLLTGAVIPVSSKRNFTGRDPAGERQA